MFQVAFEPVINNRGDIAFIGDLTPAPSFAEHLAVFLYSGGNLFAVARPGTPMPGGGTFRTASFFTQQHLINNRASVSFSAVLDQDTNRDGILDTGVYVWTNGRLQLVARTGTVIPDVGTIAHIKPPALADFPWSLGGGMINNRGQVLFAAALTDGRGVLLVATPSGTP